MAERHAEERIQHTSTSTGMRRRGLLAGAAALVAGITAKQASQRVAAGVDGDVVLGSIANATTTETGVLNSGPASPGGPAIQGFRSPGAVTVVATSLNAGVVGQTFVTDAPGVFGSSPNGSQAKGVYGLSNSGHGVHGESANGIGVQGTSTNGTGVVGTGPNGVFGTTASVGGYGGFFTTTTSQATAVGGQVFGTTSGSAAFVGAAGAGNFAAFFTGQVSINGSLFVSGGAKSAAVKHPRTNDYRALYCVESPDSWFEDVDAGKLVNGKADIKLDPDFAALIHTDDYHVFLTPYGSLGALRVATRRGDGFAVEEIGGSGSGTFSYRVVGKRSDIKLDRLAKVTMPQIKLASEPPKVPDVPAAPPDPPPPPTVPPSRSAAPAGGVQGSGGTQSNPTNPVQPIPPPRP